ncbi:MAG: CcmD family protein [Actinomycetota bacterium]
MPPDTVAWLGIGFVVSWILIGAYLVRLARAQRDIARRVEELSRKDAPPAEG